MKQYIFLGLVCAVVFAISAVSLPKMAGAVTPTTVPPAQSMSALIEQISVLKSQLSALQASRNGGTGTAQGTVVNAQSGVAVVGGTTSMSAPRMCKPPTRTLATGSTGDDVKSLQEYLNVTPTGYFGPLTESALTKWQASEGLNAVGVVGPLTRARIAERCVGPVLPPIPQASLRATPGSGSAPLTVTFSTWISGFRAPGVSNVLDFGDGKSQAPTFCLAPADACIEPGKDTHTYTKDGTYTATLYQITDICMGNTLCKAPIRKEVIGTATIVVGTGPVACTREYMPVCGSKPIVCITTPCNPIPQTYSNQCEMKADGATLLYQGECKVSTGNLPPVISSLSGPTTLAVGKKGTWTVKASDPENDSLTYSIVWGDEMARTDALAPAMGTASVRQTSTFTHSYAKAGKYTVKITVSDSEGNEAETTASIQVGRDTLACPEIYNPVCGMPTGCANTCAPGMMCTMMCQMPVPVTYSSSCFLELAGATKLHEGVCTASDTGLGAI